MLTFHVIIVTSLAALAQCQRGSFAGTRPIGFPELLNKTTTTVDPLGNRFGDGDSTTERLPLEANGDRDLVDRISKWPIDKQPFWYLNWKALEERRKNPQTYPQRPSQFAETPNFNAANSNTGTLTSKFGSGTQNSNSGNQISNVGTQSSNTVSSSLGTLSTNFGTQNSNAGTLNAATDSNIGTQNPEVPIQGNRHGGIETNSNIGGRKQVKTGFPMSGYGYHPHNRYET